MAIHALRFFRGGPSVFCFSDDPQTQSGHGIHTLQRKTKGFSDLPECVEGGRAKMQNYLNIIPIAKEMIKNKRILICQRSEREIILTRPKLFVNPPEKIFFGHGPCWQTKMARLIMAIIFPKKNEIIETDKLSGANKMDIIEFFQQSAGKWFSQRTIHNLTSDKLQAGKLELNIEILPPEDPTVIKLCQKHQTDPALASLAGARVTRQGETGATVLIPIIDRDNPQQGILLQDRGKDGSSFIGRCAIGPDDVLTLIAESESIYAEERLWYLMPNLRLRSSFVKQANGLSMACFYSEIRRLSN